MEAATAEATRRGRRSAAQWRALIAEWERSGQSQADFCRARGVALSTLSYWRRKLRDEAQPAVAETSGNNAFVELMPSVDRAALSTCQVSHD